MSVEPKNDQQKKSMAIALAIGMELIVTVLAGVFIGYYGGGYFKFAEWGAVIGSVVGFSVWIWRMVSSQKRIQ